MDVNCTVGLFVGTFSLLNVCSTFCVIIHVSGTDIGRYSAVLCLPFRCHDISFTLHGFVLNCSIELEEVTELILMTYYILLRLYQCVASFFNLLFAAFTEVTVMLFHAS